MESRNAENTRPFQGARILASVLVCCGHSDAKNVSLRPEAVLRIGPDNLLVIAALGIVGNAVILATYCRVPLSQYESPCVAPLATAAALFHFTRNRLDPGYINADPTPAFPSAVEGWPI